MSDFPTNNSDAVLAAQAGASSGAPPANAQDVLARAKHARERIVAEIGKRVFGQEEVVDFLLLGLFAGGHTLMMGVPGLAKTLLVSTLSQCLGLGFSRIQFTPDLMPSDITGTDILEDDPETGRRRFRFVPGPIFTNLLLADEINRTPPKTQSALLQAMQERQVSVGGHTYDLSAPFLVFATQNPIEQEGTYPLPEAQLDRFMFHVRVDYPSLADEMRVAHHTTMGDDAPIEQVIGPDEIIALQRLVRSVDAGNAVVDFAVRLVRATRPSDSTAPDLVKRYVTFGAGPRASQFLVLGAKTRAVLRGYEAPSVQDVRDLAHSTLRHRLLVNFHGEADGVDADAIIDELLRVVSA
ncbi:MAG: MoxR-like ATPase [Flavobacteriales bacterium]|jgi:MoxR-like ATPase